MSFLHGFRTSAVVAGGIFYALTFSGCAGAGGPQSSAAGQGAVPSVAQAYGHRHFAFGWMGRELNLSDEQRAKMRQLMQQYRQEHPRGSAFDPQARQQLHQQMLAILTPQQRTQLKQMFARMRDRWRSLNLSEHQRAQIRQLVARYRAAHPRGSAFDPQARAQLHKEILAILTPQQRDQLKRNFEHRWAS
jgi:Spy/CpxP family protein refolding chaperone